MTWFNSYPLQQKLIKFSMGLFLNFRIYQIFAFNSLLTPNTRERMSQNGRSQHWKLWQNPDAKLVPFFYFYLKWKFSVIIQLAATYFSYVATQYVPIFFMCPWNVFIIDKACCFYILSVWPFCHLFSKDKDIILTHDNTSSSSIEFSLTKIWFWYFKARWKCYNPFLSP